MLLFYTTYQWAVKQYVETLLFVLKWGGQDHVSRENMDGSNKRGVRKTCQEQSGIGAIRDGGLEALYRRIGRSERFHKMC